MAVTSCRCSAAIIWILGIWTASKFSKKMARSLCGSYDLKQMLHHFILRLLRHVHLHKMASSVNRVGKDCSLYAWLKIRFRLGKFMRRPILKPAMPVPHYTFSPHSWPWHSPVIARVVWLVSLSYNAALVRMHWPPHCHGHECGLNADWFECLVWHWHYMYSM